MSVEQSAEKRALAQKLKQQLNNCVGYEGDELANSRKQAYDYYFQRARGDEVAGRSTIVTGDLSSMVEGNLAQMVEPLTDKRIAEFCSYDARDEEQAQLESDAVSEMLFKRQNGFVEVASSIKDALLIRNAVVKVFVDVRTFKRTVRKKGVTPEIVTEVLDKIGDVKVHKFDPEDGSLSATVEKTTRRFRVVSIAPENFLRPKHWERQDLDGVPFCAERHVEPRSTLIEYGFDKALVASLPKFQRTNSTTSDARKPDGLSQQVNPIDSSQDDVEWYECYVRMDDGNGASELRRIDWSDSKILSDEPEQSELICYATGTCIINPHTWIGISLHDKLKSTQDSSTALTRGVMDNLNATTKNRTAHLDGVVEQGDLEDGRTNGSIRVNPELCPDVRMAVAPFAVPDTTGNLLQNLQYMKQTRSEMGGAALDMASGQMQLNDRVGSQGLDRAYSVMEQFARFMTRTIAQTLVRSMYLIAHDVLRTEWPGELSFKRGNTWVKTSPSSWPVRDAVKVNLGAVPGERARQSMALERMMDRQIALAQMGMEEILVNAPVFYNAFTDWVRLNDFDTPERYILDPRSLESQKAFALKAQQRAQQQQKTDAMMQQAVALEQMRTGLQKYLGDAELQFKYWNATLDAQIEEAKLTVQGVTELRKLNVPKDGGEDDDAGRETESGEGAADQSAAA